MNVNKRSHTPSMPAVSIDPVDSLSAGARGSGAEAGSRIVPVPDVKSKMEENPQAMVRLVSGLLRTISHDIRTPITTVRGFVKMMLDGRTGPISDTQRESLRMAFQGIDQLVKIGTSISDASGHIEKIHAEIVDVPALWQSVMEASRPQLLAKSVTIEDNIEGDRRSVCGDRQYLTNLLERLLTFAISAFANHGKLLVNFRCRNEITLMLTFPGVPGALAQPTLDEELASAREIAFLHGGQITVRQGKEGESILMLVLPGYNE
jgi:signal transduction histidine kinase